MVSRKSIASTQEDLINLYFSRGMTNKNAFGLHVSGSKLLADYETIHPDDDAAGVIVKALWDKLLGTKILYE